MTRFERLGNLLSWLIIFWALVWLCLIVVPQFVDRISRHENAWAKEFGEMGSEKVSRAD